MKVRKRAAGKKGARPVTMTPQFRLFLRSLHIFGLLLFLGMVLGLL